METLLWLAKTLEQQNIEWLERAVMALQNLKKYALLLPAKEF